MKPGLSTTSLSSSTLAKISPQYQSNLLPQINPNFFFFLKSRAPLSCQIKPSPSRFRLTLCFSHSPNSPVANEESNTNLEKEALNADQDSSTSWRIEEGSPIVPSFVQPAAKMSLSDQAFFLLAFIACTTSVAFTSLVIAAVPTLHAMGRAANSLSKLADTAREELPSTMAAIRLSGMEISDLTLELSDLSQEIAEGVNKSAQAVQAAEAGIRQIGSRARQQTLSMIEERANLPSISLQPVVVGAAKKTSRAVGQATKTFMNMISGGEGSSDNNNANAIERLEI